MHCDVELLSLKILSKAPHATRLFMAKSIGCRCCGPYY